MSVEEKIAKIIYKIAADSRPMWEHRIMEGVDEILALIKQEGYVQIQCGSCGESTVDPNHACKPRLT